MYIRDYRFTLLTNFPSSNLAGELLDVYSQNAACKFSDLASASEIKDYHFGQHINI